MKKQMLTKSNYHCFADFIRDNLDHSLSSWFVFDEYMARSGSSFLLYEKNIPQGLFLAGSRGNSAHISLLLVAKSLRSCGIGKLLLDEGLSSLRQAGFGEVSLEVFCENVKAVQLYLDAGFQKCGEVIKYRNHNRSFFLAENERCGQIEFADPFVLQPVLTMFSGEKRSWVRSVKNLAALLSEPVTRFALFKYNDTIAGYCIFKTDHYTLQIGDIGMQNYRADQMASFLNAVVTDEKVVTIRGCYAGSVEARLLEKLGFYPESTQIEMRMEL